MEARQEDLRPRIKAPGLHLIGDLYDCRCDRRLMTDATALRAHCSALVYAVGLTSVGNTFHEFPGEGGVTGVIVLAESHLSVHTWPESEYVTVDVYVCNYQTDNRLQARRLFHGVQRLFNPANPRVIAIPRA